MIFRWLTERRREKLLEKPFADTWKQYLHENVAAYRLFDDEEKARFHDLVAVFVAEKNFEQCGGLDADEAEWDEIRVTIAGCACQMLVGRQDHDLFSEVVSLLVYPSAVVAKAQNRSFFDPGLEPVRGDMPVLGLAVKGGAVVLAWDSVLRGARHPHDGHNVVIHELAHKIDYLDGVADGTPPLDGRAARRAWVAAFAPAYLAHKERAEHGKKSFLSDYAVTNEAEYFAVATEAFFEKPADLARELPDVYAQLRDFYQLDLAAR
jgi:Mlc titration factor MtfA (ptsG expression regulator)